MARGVGIWTGVHNLLGCLPVCVCLSVCLSVCLPAADFIDAYLVKATALEVRAMGESWW